MEAVARTRVSLVLQTGEATGLRQFLRCYVDFHARAWGVSRGDVFGHLVSNPNLAFRDLFTLAVGWDPGGDPN